MNFPTGSRNAQGKILYDQFARRCLTETEDRAQEIAAEIKGSYILLLYPHSSANDRTLEEFLEYFIAAQEKSLIRHTFNFTLSNSSSMSKNQISDGAY